MSSLMTIMIDCDRHDIKIDFKIDFDFSLRAKSDSHEWDDLIRYDYARAMSLEAPRP
jgi:hypothetical protein